MPDDIDSLKAEIARAWAEREALKQEMEAWFSQGHRTRFPKQSDLGLVTERLSDLDSRFKKLWDAQNAAE